MQIYFINLLGDIAQLGEHQLCPAVTIVLAGPRHELYIVGLRRGKLTQWRSGAVAQLGERELCKLEAGGSNPLCSTRYN